MKLLLSGFGILCASVLTLFALAWQPPMEAVDLPSYASFSRDDVDRGASLATAGNCRECHTALGGKPYAGGYDKWTRFTIYSTNITPDLATGIGRWSERAFVRAMRQGIARDGSQLFSAFPFEHYTKLTEPDLKALYAHLMTNLPVTLQPPVKPSSFPFDVRVYQVVWKALFLRLGTYQSDPTKSPAWNRGAYLVEALAACGVCHTPRSAFGAEQVGHPLAGSPIGHWRAPPLDLSQSPARWTKEDFFSYLRGGTTKQGRAIGPMATIVTNLASLPDTDIEAIAVYLVDGNRPAGAAVEAGVLAAHQKSIEEISPEHGNGPRLYAFHCASCHENIDRTSTAASTSLSLTTALWDTEPVNFISVVLIGFNTEDSKPGSNMPSFLNTLSADDVTAIGSYLRKTRTNQPVWRTLGEMTHKIQKLLLPQ